MLSSHTHHPAVRRNAAGRLTHLAPRQPRLGCELGVTFNTNISPGPGAHCTTWMHLATLHPTHHLAVWPLHLFLPQANIFVSITLGLSVGGPPCDRRGFSDEPEPFSNCRAIFLGSFDLTWILESWPSWSTTHLISFKVLGRKVQGLLKIEFEVTEGLTFFSDLDFFLCLDFFSSFPFLCPFVLS